jgi:hypothetical protein
MKLQLFAVAATAVVSVVAACGGGGTSTPAAVSTPRPVASVSSSTPATAAATSAPSAVAPSAAASAATLDLCGLLTVSDVQTALGGSWLEGQLTSTGGYCHWDSGNNPNDRVITAVDPRPLLTIKSAASGGVDFEAGDVAGYSYRDEASHVLTTYLDHGLYSVIVEIPTTTDAADDQAHAQALSEVAAGNF